MSKTLERAFLLYGPELRGYLKQKMGSAHAAADIAQDTFVRIAEIPASRAPRDLRAYLFQVARNLLIDHVRQENRRQTFPTPSEDFARIADEAPSAEEMLLARERIAHLRDALAELSPRTRDIFSLNRIEGLSYAQVASRLGISESSVQKHLALALRHLTARVGPP
ncbi:MULTISPECIES: RNA polymerase sigma factor [unclassified Xanthobacter]|uniref:RNA polymerase sigma factor n=1 Tax=unclassified Xanthobacter TaxID=2623496 RepID=UPI001EE0E931